MRRGLNGLMALIRQSVGAIGRARRAILSVALTYALSVVIGIAMVSTGNQFALDRRDALVSTARSSDILVADRAGDHARAALLDFAANLGLGGVTSTAVGVGVVLVYPVVAYRGWVGGIVSVEDRHVSRLADPVSAAYYVVTLVLQLIPYSMGAWAFTSGSDPGAHSAVRPRPGSVYRRIAYVTRRGHTS